MLLSVMFCVLAGTCMPVFVTCISSIAHSGVVMSMSGYRVSGMEWASIRLCIRILWRLFASCERRLQIWYPNAKLQLEPVMNVARSNNRWEGFKVPRPSSCSCMLQCSACQSRLRSWNTLTWTANPCVLSIELALPPKAYVKEAAYALQALVDMATPAAVFEAVDAAVTAHMKSEKGATEFTGEHICVANFATDPQKVTLCVWWEFSHPGERITSPMLLMLEHAYLACSNESSLDVACFPKQ